MKSLLGKLDHPPMPRLRGPPACLPGLCLREDKPSWGLVTPRNFLEGDWYSPLVLCFSLAVVLEEKIHFYVFIRQLKSMPASLPTPRPPCHVPRKACSLAKAHMAFLCFKCSSYYLDLNVYRVKETFMEQLRPVRT